MDIANYLSELLDRHGKVGVPGLGYFTQMRVNGYYHETEKQFYPPGYQIQFNPEPSDDDTLVQHIAEKKKISLASSKYFTEKYITGLKQEVASKEVPFANLGWFYTSHGQIAFKPNHNHNDDPEFYGYAPIALKKLNEEPEKPVPPPLPFSLSAPEPVAEPTPTPVPVPQATSQPVEYEEQEVFEEPKRSSNTWIIVTLVIIIIAAAAFGIYKYKPELFGSQQTTKTVEEQAKPERSIKPDTLVADTTKTAPPILDTPSKAISKPQPALNTPVANADTVAKPQYVIFAGSFKTQAKSDLAVKNYKSIGIDARMLNGPGTGRLIKIIIGGFATYQEGETLRLKLVKSGKLRKDSYTQIINQKK